MSNHVLFEIGVEELPARFIDDALKQLTEKTAAWLQEERLKYGEIKSFSTPRRLAVQINDLAAQQESLVEEVRGPQLNIAKDQDGNWSKAAEGFCKGQGKTVEDIYIEEIKDIPYIFVKKQIDGITTKDVLPTFREVIAKIQFPQMMRWGTGTFRFNRPIRWLVALYNDEVIPFEISNVHTSNITYGHRFLGETITLTNATEYEATLAENFVIANPLKREQMIIEQLKQLEEQAKFNIVIEKDLLNEVRNLVEYPTAFYGTFQENYLTLPAETLITSMKEHQRYFPVTDDDGKLLPYFVSVRNGDDTKIENVARGNEKVLRARLADAVFFYEEDRKHSIDFFVKKLETVVFQEKIGTVYQKQKNVKKLATKIAEHLQVDQETKRAAERAAEICKFDLVTDMVNEFPELQGILGEKYALHYGEDKNVATAIREHYLPLQASGVLPETKAGSIVSVADKLDTIVGCIAAGLIPTGSQDPYSLRRQTIGILRILLEGKWDITVEELFELAAQLYDEKENAKVLQQFIHNRATYLLSENDSEQDVIQAVLHDKIGVFHYSLEKAQILSKKRNDQQFKNSQEAFVRVVNIGKKHEQTTIDEELFQTDSERSLYQTYLHVKTKFSSNDKNFQADAALAELEKLTEPIHAFFLDNMVMDENKEIRNNRLALVHLISELILQFADITLIEWKQHNY